MRPMLFAALLFLSGHSMSAAGHAPLRLQLSASAGRARLADQVKIEARIQNVGDEPVSIYGILRWGFAGGFVLRIADAHGKEVHPKKLDDDLIIPSTLQDPASFVTLQERHFIGVERSDPARELFTSAGVYTIWLEYLSPVPASYGHGPHFWSRESGRLVSNRVKIEILQ